MLRRLLSWWRSLWSRQSESAPAAPPRRMPGMVVKSYIMPCPSCGCPTQGTKAQSAVPGIVQFGCEACRCHWIRVAADLERDCGEVIEQWTR